MKTSLKKIEILNHAQEMIQKRGYNGFSYADISKIVGIRKASIHHHFPSKVALAVAVIRRYREIFDDYLVKITHDGKDWLDKIRRYAKLYEAVLREERLCLCGMLASDIETLPKILKKEIREFFIGNVAWLITVLVSHYKLISNKRLSDVSWEIISSLQGAVIMAKMLNKPELFSSMSKELFIQLENLK